MAGANKRTTVALATVAVIFIIVIIILCLVPDPCRRNDPRERCREDNPYNKAQTSGTLPTESSSTAAPTSPSSTESTSPTDSNTPDKSSSLLSTTVTSSPPSSSTESPSSTTITESSSTIAGPSTTGSSSTVSTTEVTSTYIHGYDSTTVSEKSSSLSSTTSTSSLPSSSSESTSSTTIAESTSMTAMPDTDSTLEGTNSTISSTTEVSSTNISGDNNTTVSDTSSSFSSTIESTSPTPISTESSTFPTTPESTSTTATPETTSSSTVILEEETNSTVSTTTEVSSSSYHSNSSTTVAGNSSSTSVITSTIPSTTSTSTTTDSSTLSDVSTFIPRPATDDKVCDTPVCREVARRMWDIVDPEDIDPCEDFYQYSCGGILDDPFLKPENPQHYADKLIKEALAKGDRDEENLKELFTVYDSCLNYTNAYDLQERLQAANSIIESFGLTFNPKAEQIGRNLLPDFPEKFDLTETLIEMMRRNFAPFFDLLIDVNKKEFNLYNLKMVLPMMKSPYSMERAQSICMANYAKHAEEAKNKGETFDIDSYYLEYYNCKYWGKGLEARLAGIEKKVKSLNLTAFINDTHVEEQIISSAKFKINFILEKIGKVIPSPPEIRKALINKDYELYSVKDIDEGRVFGDIPIKIGPFVKELIFKNTDLGTMMVQVYFKDIFKQIFDIIYDELDGEELAFQNALLLLWTERVYDDLISPIGFTAGSPEYCFNAVTTHMDDYVSYLYLKELEKPEYEHIDDELKNMIEMSKIIIEEQLEKSSLTSKEDFKKKAESMYGHVAKPFEVELNEETKITVVENEFVTNYENLQKNFRKRLYQLMMEETTFGRWSVFQLVYRGSAVTSYGLNAFFAPHGVMAPPYFYKDAPGYINYAGVGHMIAHEFMHGFDSTGLKFNRGHEEAGPITPDEKVVSATECLAEQLSGTFTMNSSTGLAVNFTLHDKLALNELLSDVAATRLAWDTYQRDLVYDPEPTAEVPSWKPSAARRRRRQASMDSGAVATRTGDSSRAELLTDVAGFEDFGFMFDQKLIHWEKFSALQLYFIKLAQNHCTSKSEIDLISVKENEHLPAKLRVNLALGNNPLFHKAFGCNKRKSIWKMVPQDGQCPFRPLGDFRY